MENPFQFGRELGADELVDREEEIPAVAATIRQGGKLLLIGPRRFGKTSVLKAAEDRLSRQRAAILRLDAESYPSLDLLVSALVAAAAKNLRGSVERTGELIQKVFAKLRPAVTFSITDREWSVQLGVVGVEDSEKHLDLLVDALDGVERLAQAQPKARPVGLVIDEFQKVIELGGYAAEGQIRAAIQRHRRTGCVFAGSKTRLLSGMTMDAARPFYRLGGVRFIGPLPTEDFKEFLRTKFIESGFAVEGAEGDEAVALILRSAEEVPYNVQVLAHACWDQLRGGVASKDRTLTPAVVERSLDRTVRQFDPLYTQLWNRLTAIQQKTLVSVITERGVNLQSMKVVRAMGKGPSTVRRALQALTARDILREEEATGSVRVRFEDPFFAQWITRFTAHF